MCSLILGIFLGVLCIIALLKVVGFLFGSHPLDVVMDVVAESVSVFLFEKKETQTCDRFVLLLLDVYLDRCNWKTLNKSSKF